MSFTLGVAHKCDVPALGGGVRVSMGRDSGQVKDDTSAKDDASDGADAKQSTGISYPDDAVLGHVISVFDD